jgi:hypothetical protein
VNKKKPLLDLKRNHDYTISVVDVNKRELVFRDMTGGDLEFFDYILKYDPEEKAKEDTSLSFDDICTILNKLLVRPHGFTIGKLTKPTIYEVFVLVRENILCNYLPKVIWLKYCYGMQNSSFANLKQMESVPMSKFVVMAEIHAEIVSNISPGGDGLGVEVQDG